MLNLIFVKKSLTLFQSVLLVVFVSLGVLIFMNRDYFNSSSPAEKLNAESPLVIHRNQTFKYAKPFVFFDLANPSTLLLPLKNIIREYINQQSQNGTIFQASMYLRDLETGEWTSVNEAENYHPGSLIKVPMLIYYLKKSESDPTILDKKLKMGDEFRGVPNQTYTDKSIEKNKEYSVRELLKYMVSYSDNNATYLLNNNCNEEEFKKVFTDMGLVLKDVHDTSYTISVRNYSIFIRVLYNATYLNSKNSDYALSLLSQSSFNLGMSSKLPKDVGIAHKFGETKMDGKRELHESGIIYCNHRPYQLTIMTKGYNPMKLAGFISSVSDTIFRFFCV